MTFEEKYNKFIVSFNELEINNELMVGKFIRWILEKDFFQQNCIYLCKWQSIKNPTPFQDKREYQPNDSLQNKLIKKFSIKQAGISIYFSIFKVNVEDFTVDFVLRNCFTGQLFSIKDYQLYDTILDEIEGKLRNDEHLLENLDRNEYLNYFNLNSCQLLNIEQIDNPTLGICSYTFSVI